MRQEGLSEHSVCLALGAALRVMGKVSNLSSADTVSEDAQGGMKEMTLREINEFDLVGYTALN